MPVGFRSESFQGATSESRANMRAGFGEPASAGAQEAAAERLEQCSKQVELESAREERTGVRSTRLAGLRVQLGHAKGDARRAGLDVEDDPVIEDGDGA